MTPERQQEILKLIEECTVDLANLRAPETLVKFRNQDFLIRGTLSLVTSTHTAATAHLLGALAESLSTGNSLDDFTAQKTSMVVIDAVSSPSALSGLNNSLSERGRGVKLLSMRGGDCAQVLDAVEAIAKRERPGVIVINDMSAILSKETYRCVSEALKRLQAIAERHDTSILMIGAAGFKISLKRPSRVGSLYLSRCAAIGCLTHSLKDGSYNLLFHHVYTMTTLDANYFLSPQEVAKVEEPESPKDPKNPDIQSRPARVSILNRKIVKHKGAAGAPCIIRK